MTRRCLHCERRLGVGVARLCRRCAWALPAWIVAAIIGGAS